MRHRPRASRVGADRPVQEEHRPGRRRRGLDRLTAPAHAQPSHRSAMPSNAEPGQPARRRRRPTAAQVELQTAARRRSGTGQAWSGLLPAGVASAVSPAGLPERRRGFPCSGAASAVSPAGSSGALGDERSSGSSSGRSMVSPRAGHGSPPRVPEIWSFIATRTAPPWGSEGGPRHGRAAGAEGVSWRRRRTPDGAGGVDEVAVGPEDEPERDEVVVPSGVVAAPTRTPETSRMK